MRNSWRVIATAVALALTGYFIWFAAHTLSLDVLRTLFTSPLLLVSVVIAALLYSMIVPITGWAWAVLLDRQGEHWHSLVLSRILGLTQLAKYVPGNVVQHATRAALSIRIGIGKRAFVASVIQETILAILASLIVGIGLLVLSPVGLARLSTSSLDWLMWLGLILGVATLVLGVIELRPERFSAHRNGVLRMLARCGGVPGPTATFSALGAYIANYLLIGLGLWLVSRAAGFPPELDYTLVTAGFALSWALGFLAPGAPAGLGVREGIMLIIFNGAASNEIVIAFVVLTRVVTMLGDALCFVAASFAGSNAAIRARGSDD